MNTRYDDLVIALVAAYSVNKTYMTLEDDDFAPDPEGDWVKYRGSWDDREFSKSMNAVFSLSFGVKRTNGELPDFIKEAKDEHLKFCAELDALPRFKLVTTLDQRILRKARQRASEIIAADTGTSAAQELVKARIALALTNDALAMAHDLNGSDDPADLIHDVMEVIKVSGKAIAAIERAGSVGPKETMNDLLKPVFDRLVHGRSQGMPEDGVLAGYVKMANDMLP
jgi:hypothetical protein